jgi:hypothetical protein
MIDEMVFVNCASGLALILLVSIGGAWQRMSFDPIIQTDRKAGIRGQPVRVMCALSACLLFHAYFIPFTHDSARDISQCSRDRETDSSSSLAVSSLVVLPSHDPGSSRNPGSLAGDSLVCVETEDLDRIEEDPGHSHAFPGAGLIPLGEFSSHGSPRAPLLSFLAIHGLMSRRC